jgi:hypothetical protein
MAADREPVRFLIFAATLRGGSLNGSWLAWPPRRSAQTVGKST